MFFCKNLKNTYPHFLCISAINKLGNFWGANMFSTFGVNKLIILIWGKWMVLEKYNECYESEHYKFYFKKNTLASNDIEK